MTELKNPGGRCMTCFREAKKLHKFFKIQCSGCNGLAYEDYGTIRCVGCNARINECRCLWAKGITWR